MGLVSGRHDRGRGRGMTRNEQTAAILAAGEIRAAQEEMVEYLDTLEERCAHCGARLYTVVRGHHHAEDGKDVTRLWDGQHWKGVRA